MTSAPATELALLDLLPARPLVAASVKIGLSGLSAGRRLYTLPRAAFAHLTGNSIPVSIGTGFTIMDASNIDDPNVAKYIYSE